MAGAPCRHRLPVDVEGHFYSVPYRFVRTEVEVCLTGRTIEIFADVDGPSFWQPKVDPFWQCFCALVMATATGRISAPLERRRGFRPAADECVA
jgi:hypothetical protein